MWFYSWLSIIICFLYSARFVEKAAWKSLRSSGPFSTPQLLVSRLAYRRDYNCCECRQIIKENSSWHVTSWRMTQARLLASGMYLCICCVLFRELKRLAHLSASRAMTVREVWKLVSVARIAVRSLHWHARRNVCPRPEIYVNNNHIFSSYLAGDIGYLSCVNQPVNAAWGDKRCCEIRMEHTNVSARFGQNVEFCSTRSSCFNLYLFYAFLL